jgi:hypothetical protein
VNVAAVLALALIVAATILAALGILRPDVWVALVVGSGVALPAKVALPTK